MRPLPNVQGECVILSTEAAHSAIRRVPTTPSRVRTQVAVPKLTREDEILEITFTVRRGDAPALKSALDEIRGEVGGRLEGMHLFAKEAALTNAARALGRLYHAVHRLVPTGDAYYG